MGTRSKGKTRIKPYDLPGLRRWLMPRRDNPELRRYLHGCKLGLRQPHPVLFRYREHIQHLASGEKVLRLKQRSSFPGECLAGKERNDARTLPSILGRRHARFSEQGLFSICLCICIFDTDAQRVQRIQRVTHTLYPILRAHQTQFKHGAYRLCWSSHCSR